MRHRTRQVRDALGVRRGPSAQSGLGPRRRCDGHRRAPRPPVLTQRFQDQVDEVDPLVRQVLVGFHGHVHVPVTLLVAHVDRDPCRDRRGEGRRSGEGSQNPAGRPQARSCQRPGAGPLWDSVSLPVGLEKGLESNK